MLTPVSAFLKIAEHSDYAFLLGALALLASAFLTAGVGPWTPFQMIAAGSASSDTPRS